MCFFKVYKTIFLMVLLWKHKTQEVLWFCVSVPFWTAFVSFVFCTFLFSFVLTRTLVWSDRIAVVVCHVKTSIWLHKIWPEALHITQAVTQSKIAKIAQITQNNTSFSAHFEAFYGLKRVLRLNVGLFTAKNVFLMRFRKIEFCLNLFIMKNSVKSNAIFTKLSKLGVKVLIFMVAK